MTEQGIDRTTIKNISGHKTDSVFNRYDIKDLRQQQNAFEKMAVSDKIKGLRRYRLRVRSSPSQGENPGSNPGTAAIKPLSSAPLSSGQNVSWIHPLFQVRANTAAAAAVQNRGISLWYAA